MSSSNAAIQSTELHTVKKCITVAAPPRIAFEVFTTRMSSWWPIDTHHIGKIAAREAVLEPRVGGRWFERGVDGSECGWGHVLAWDPPNRLVLSWEISFRWEADPSMQTEVEVRFVADGPKQTRVELEHRYLDRFGEHRDEMRAMFESSGGWLGLLELFAKDVERAGGGA